MAPEGWTQATIGEVAVRRRDRVEPSENPNLPYVGLQHLKPRTREIPDYGRLSEVKSSKSRFGAGDILFGKLRPYLHKVAQANRDGGASTDIMIIQSKEGVDQDFLYWRLASTKVVRLAERYSRGTRMPRTSWKAVSSFEIPVPPRDEQERIATILSHVDRVIAATRKVRDQAEKVMTGLLNDLMTKGIGHSRFQETENGTIPEEWRVCPLDSLGNGTRPMVKAGPFGSKLKKSHYTDDGYKIYGQEQVLEESHQFGDYFIDRDRYLELESCAVQPGDVLVTLVGTPGKTLVLPEDCQEGVINPRLVRISPDPDLVDPQFLGYWLESPPTQRALSRLAQGGTMEILNSTMISSLSIGLPPLPEQREIVCQLSRLEEIVERQESATDTLRNLQRALMQDLLTGRVRVPAA